MKKPAPQCLVRLPSGVSKVIDSQCRATIGVVSNPNHGVRKLRKAGQSRWLGKHPIVRGVAMNPVDHPHGGGEGRTNGGRPSVSPWGPTKAGFQTVVGKHRNSFMPRRYIWKEGSLDKRIHSRISFFVESSTNEKKSLVKAKKRLTHFIREANDHRFTRTTKTTISLFPFFGATFFFLRDWVGVSNNQIEDAREQLLGKLRIKLRNLISKVEFIEKLIDLCRIGELRKGIEMMIEFILRNRKIPYGYNSYLNKVQKMRSFLSNEKRTHTILELVKIKSVYQSVSPIAQDISFQPRKKKKSFRSIFSQIVKDIQLVLTKGVEGIRICCSGRLKAAEIAKTECEKYRKTSRNVFPQKIDYALAEVVTRYGISGVIVLISYSQKNEGRAIS
ncbi:hypothetical protein AMTRI_Chr12g269690 [Amborella trichopoda]